MSKITIKSINGEIIIEGEYNSVKYAVEKNKINLCEADLRWANLRGVDLRNADLTNADLRGANLRNANLSEVNLRCADLRCADLRGVDLRNANLSRADLRKADLSHADLRWAELIISDLRNADLTNADMCYADLRGVDLSYARGINKNVVCQLNYLYDQVGKIRLYKLVNEDYQSPFTRHKATYKIGDIVSVADANTDDTVLCGAGVNVATLDWCIKEWREGRHIMIVEFTADDIACIPIATDGKIRLHRCKVVGEKDLKELGLIKHEEASDE